MLTFPSRVRCLFVSAMQQMAPPFDPLGRLDQDAAAMAALREAVSRRADR